MWNMDNAQGLIHAILPIVTDAGFAIALTGSVLMHGRSEKDVDIILYPLRSDNCDHLKLIEGLHEYGLTRVFDRESVLRAWRKKGSMDTKWVEVWELNGNRIDLFFLQ